MGMKVGVLQFFSWSRRVPLTAVYARAFSRIQTMDQAGYDCVWLAEHHFNTYSVCPSINVMAAHVASITRNLRVGLAVSLAAFYNPLRLAEEVAMLDVLSGGRVNWGAGRGFDRAEFEAFGVPVEESSDRFRECVEIVLAAWRSERLAYEGRFWRYDGIEVLPKPLQAPHPPVWLAATSLDSIRRAAEKGYDILQDPHATHTDIGRKRAHYYEVLRAHGFPTEGRVIPTARLLAVGATDQEADEVARAGASWTVASYANPTKRAGPPPCALGARDRSGGALHERGRDPRHPRAGARHGARAARDDRPRLPHVRAAEPPQLHALHRASAAQARLGCVIPGAQRCRGMRSATPPS
jgi:alkanesulfonate monooxygenase SsuD/methylene tetrahydromethanopterin reductase-like flavin-dependent oxidoreductase (luciferase family)